MSEGVLCRNDVNQRLPELYSLFCLLSNVAGIGVQMNLDQIVERIFSNWEEEAASKEYDLTYEMDTIR